VRWVWDESKNAANKKKHDLSLKSGAYVFNDPLSISRDDPYPHEERWQTIGLVGSMTVIVIHTWPDYDPNTDDVKGRIISVREATIHERKSYEEGTF
jgi:uncharacterized protein